MSIDTINPPHLFNTTFNKHNHLLRGGVIDPEGLWTPLIDPHWTEEEREEEDKIHRMRQEIEEEADMIRAENANRIRRRERDDPNYPVGWEQAAIEESTFELTGPEVPHSLQEIIPPNTAIEEVPILFKIAIATYGFKKVYGYLRRMFGKKPTQRILREVYEPQPPSAYDTESDDRRDAEDYDTEDYDTEDEKRSEIDPVLDTWNELIGLGQAPLLGTQDRERFFQDSVNRFFDLVDNGEDEEYINGLERKVKSYKKKENLTDQELDEIRFLSAYKSSVKVLREDDENNKTFFELFLENLEKLDKKSRKPIIQKRFPLIDKGRKHYPAEERFIDTSKIEKIIGKVEHKIGETRERALASCGYHIGKVCKDGSVRWKNPEEGCKYDACPEDIINYRLSDPNIDAITKFQSKSQQPMDLGLGDVVTPILGNYGGKIREDKIEVTKPTMIAFILKQLDERGLGENITAETLQDYTDENLKLIYNQLINQYFPVESYLEQRRLIQNPGVVFTPSNSN